MIFIPDSVPLRKDEQIIQKRGTLLYSFVAWIHDVKCFKMGLLFFLPPLPRTTPSLCISSRAGGTSDWRTQRWHSIWPSTTAWLISSGYLTPTSWTTRSPSCTGWQSRTAWSGSTLTARCCTDWGTPASAFLGKHYYFFYHGNLLSFVLSFFLIHTLDSQIV